jgi:nucleoside phosphorylase
MVMSSLRDEVSTKAAVLVGMAAGVPDKTSLGDVVVAETVYEYEFARMGKSGPSFAPRPYPVEDKFIRDIELFPGLFRQWTTDCRDVVRESERAEFAGSKLKKKDLESWYPELMRGVILAGGKLLEDGSLPKMRKTFHDRTRAAEMEGGGFAAACNEFSWRWMVFRGIADFGEPERVKGWQFPATVAAALVVRYGLLGGVIRGSTFLQ